MKVNSNIDFIQASGGNVLETHHMEFETRRGADPGAQAHGFILPSGSLWFHPNDDLARAGETRTEHLRYQHASGIAPDPSKGLTDKVLRIDEGYAAYGVHLGPASSARAMPSVPNNFDPNMSGMVDNKFYDHFDDTFAVKASGLYRISYQFTVRNKSSGGNNDGVNQVRVLRNGVEISQSVARYYQSGSTSVALVSKTFLTNLDLEDSIIFEWDIINGGGNSYDWSSPNTSFICFEFIRRTDHEI